MKRFSTVFLTSSSETVVPIGPASRDVSTLRGAVFTSRKSGALVGISLAADDVAEKFNNRRAVQATNCSLARFSGEPLFQVVFDAKSSEVRCYRLFQVRQI